MLARPSETQMQMQTPLWVPGPEQFEHSQLARFTRSLGFDPGKYEELHRWSVSDLDGFWNAVWEFGGVIGERGQVALVRQGEGVMFGARWYPEARLNFAENLLCGADDRLAVVQASEDGVRERVSMGQLRARVASLAQGLRSMGVQSGDVVGGILPNRIEALVALFEASRDIFFVKSEIFGLRICCSLRKGITEFALCGFAPDAKRPPQWVAFCMGRWKWEVRCSSPWPVR